MKFLSTGFMRGIFSQIFGTLAGMGFVMLMRVIKGLEAWDAEPVVVGGAAVGAVAFLVGTGVFNDWFKWAKGKSTPDHLDPDPDQPGWRRYFNVDHDHKVIGIQYGVTSIVVLLLAGFFAILFRIELASSGVTFLNNPTWLKFLNHDSGESLYNSFMSLHGIVMVAAILLGVGGIINYILPLLLGANDMAFPRLNAFAYWVNVPGAILVVGSLFFGGFDTGWTGYPPLSIRAPLGVQLFLLGVYFIGLSSIFGSINIIVTIFKMRAPGMTMFKMPIFAWSALATAIIQLTATQLIGLSFQMVMFERLLGMSFFDSSAGGDPLLFQHLFWFYSHPAVYVFVLPGFGIISELLPVFVRKPLFGYRWIAFSSIGIALVGFFVWAHHMFTSGMVPYLRVPFMYSTLLVAVPTGVKFFSWVGTIWRGKITFPTPMLFVLGAMAVFLLGGVTGPPNATVATDLHLQDTYWIVGHFHNTMFGGFIFPLTAAIYYWFPKMTGRRLSEKLGYLHFVLLFVGFEVMSIGQMRIGLLGMRRRIADYSPRLADGLVEDIQLWITISGFVVALSMLVFIFNLVKSARRGEVAEGNIWNSRSPEWQIPNPAPLHNYKTPFKVIGDPYDYGLPDAPYLDMNPEKSSD